MVARVDFFIVGAQKGGTTALYQYLRGHPDIQMPRQKETSFFFRDELYERGIDWYLTTFFSSPSAYRNRKLGEASPQYMYGLNVPARINRHFPDAKLIALLRNPVDRAYSAFRMQVRRGVERRSFEQVVSELIGRHATMGRMVSLEDEVNNYLAAGCYATILRRYLTYFDISQLKCVVSEDLLLKPRATLREVLKFIGVNADYKPWNLGKRYHMGGEVRSRALQLLIREPNRVIKTLLRYLPFAKRRGIAYRLEQWNLKPVKSEGPDWNVRRRLVEWYAPEVSDLLAVFGVSPGWGEFEEVADVCG